MGFIITLLWKSIRQVFYPQQVHFNYNGFACLGRYDDETGQFVATVCHPDLAAVLWGRTIHELERSFCELIDQYLQGLTAYSNK